VEIYVKIIIAGAGIGGLAAALAAHQAGIKVEIIESVAAMQRLGVGINLLPHSAKVLQSLGVLDDLLDRGVQTRELVYFNKHGQRIWGEPRGLHAGYPTPQISLSRGILQGVLHDHVIARMGADVIKRGHKLIDFEDAANSIRVTAQTDSGSVIHEADALIAADGIHSAARAKLYPDQGDANYSGRVLWRATTRAKPFLTAETMVMIGYQDRKFVAYPIEAPGDDGLQTINWIAEEPRPLAAREDWNRLIDRSEFAGSFANWQFDWLDVPALIAGAERVYEYPMVDRDPLPRWSHGRMTLLGDAAHPMFPIGSNGASQAILDCEALVANLISAPNVEAALASYDDQRRPATSAIVLSNRKNGPEQCMQIAEERAPEGFTDIQDIMSREELEEISARYKQIAGFDAKKMAEKV
jgi:5-methylphenazine-1-carboxylate 1-monooxygenase